MARRTKLNTDIADRLIEAQGLGLNNEAVAAYGGIARKTLQIWLVKGELAKTGIYHDFYVDWQSALAKTAAKILSEILLSREPTSMPIKWKWLQAKYSEFRDSTDYPMPLGMPQIRVLWGKESDDDDDPEPAKLVNPPLPPPETQSSLTSLTSLPPIEAPEAVKEAVDPEPQPVAPEDVEVAPEQQKEPQQEAAELEAVQAENDRQGIDNYLKSRFDL